MKEILIKGVESGREFNILKKVNSGSVGNIYYAREKGADYAMKLSKAGSRELINKHSPPDEYEEIGRTNDIPTEAGLQSRIRHPHVTPIIIADKHQDTPFLVMPIADTDLYQRIQKKSLTEDEKATICIQTAEGLREIHEKGIIHNDVKTNNVLLHKQDGKLVSAITDFGNAVTVGTTYAGFGARLYTAPEQFAGTTTQKSDQYRWATGIIYPTVTGKNAYEMSYSDFDFLNEDVYIPPAPKSFSTLLRRPPTAMEEAIEEVAHRATSYYPSARYPSMGEVLDDLEMKVTKVKELQKKGRKSFS